jgi:hypothetical protein
MMDARHLLAHAMASDFSVHGSFSKREQLYFLLWIKLHAPSSLKVYTRSGANPSIANYNASVVNFSNATGSLARFENKNILFYF